MKIIITIKAFLTLVVLALIVSTNSHALEIQKFLTPNKKLYVYLVEEHSLPMVSVNISFRSGAAFEGEKHGIASFMASLIDEGAGANNSAEFQQKMEDIGAIFSVGAGDLDVTLSLRTLSENKNSAFMLMGEAITNPRFDAEAVERIRTAIIASLKKAKESSSAIASKAFNKALYGKHAYTNSSLIDENSINSISQNDIKNYHKNNFQQSGMTISVVGDITKKELGKLLDKSFKNIYNPEDCVCNYIKKAPQTPTPQVIRIPMNIPQTTVMMGHEGVGRHDKDYFAAYFMNYILGGGGFNSRLMEEIREKRGLAYGVYSYFSPMPQRGSFVAKVQTKNKDAAESIHLIKAEIQRIIDDGVSEKEYQGALSYLTGSFPLRFDSSGKILGYLNVMQTEDLGADYLDTWVTNIKKVTKSDIQRVAKRLLKPNAMVTVIVGGE